MAADDANKVDLYDDVVLLAVKIVRQTFRVALPGIVQNFARDTTRVAVAFGTRFRDMARGVRDEPPIADLPVILPRAGGYGFHVDMTEGDLAVVLACDGPVRGLYETGDAVTPQIIQGHEYGCGVVLPGGRVSSTETPTPPPNAEGTLLVGADDGSAAVIFRGAGLSDPAELGSMVLATAGPTASLMFGADAATLGVARLGDDVAAVALFTTWIGQVTTAINTLAPGSVTPFVAPNFGTISSASTKVVTE